MFRRDGDCWVKSTEGVSETGELQSRDMLERRMLAKNKC